MLVRLDRDVGVDIERADRVSDIMDIATRHFSSDESETLLALPGPQQRRCFFELWTLKEAYLKARGAGLSVPLDCIAFQLDGRAGVNVRSPQFNVLSDDAARWQFTLDWFDGLHVVATAAMDIRAQEGPRIVRTVVL